MPSKRRLEQLRNARLVAVERAKKRKIEKTPNTTTTAQPSIDHNQLCNDDTNDTVGSEGADTRFSNSSANESCPDSKGNTKGGQQSDEEKSDVGVKQPRTKEAAPLRNAVKEVRWRKEGENNLRGGYGKGSRSTNKGQGKATKELEKEASKTYNIMALWQHNRDLGPIPETNISSGHSDSFPR